MNKAVLGSALLLVGGCSVTAKSIVDVGATSYPPNDGNICLLAGSPPSNVVFEELGRVVATKRSYGPSDDLFLPMALEARKLGADAIINLQASQRFKGPLPWRITSPTGDGIAIKVLPDSPKIECLLAGGRMLGPDGLVTRAAAPSIVPRDLVQKALSENAEASSSDTPAQRVDIYKEILKLDDLRNRGLLTDQEFELEKKKLLEKN